MNYNNLNYHYIHLMQEAELATNRADAIECINKATKLKQAMIIQNNQCKIIHKKWLCPFSCNGFELDFNLDDYTGN